MPKYYLTWQDDDVDTAIDGAVSYGPWHLHTIHEPEEIDMQTEEELKARLHELEVRHEDMWQALQDTEDEMVVVIDRIRELEA